MGHFRSKFEIFKENLRVLINDLLTSDGLLDLDEKELDMMIKNAFVEIDFARFKLTKRGIKALTEGLKMMQKEINE